MGKLIVTSQGVLVGEYPLSEQRMTIGRHAECDICIDDLSVSAKHALITNILEDSFIDDLDSTNGVYLNGELTKKCMLAHGDLISVGNHVMRFEQTAVNRNKHFAVAADQGMEDELFGELQTENEVTPQPGKQSAQPVSLVGRLKVLSGPATGNQLTLDGKSVTLGKPGVQTATIVRRETSYFLLHASHDDSNDDNPPKVNGEAVGGEDYCLKAHDVIELVGVELEFTVDD